MKTIQLIILGFFFIINVSTAQTADKYQKAMEKQVAILDTARSVESIQSLMNTFDRIATLEKDKWLPYYYAGLCSARLMYRFKDAAQIDGYGDKADAYLEKAEAIQANNADLSVVRALVCFARINVDFMSRGPQYSGMANNHLAKGYQIDPKNPRVLLMMAQSKYNTPEMFGGDKVAGCKLIAQSLPIFEQAPANTIDPHWGLADAQAISKKCAAASQN